MTSSRLGKLGIRTDADLKVSAETLIHWQAPVRFAGASYGVTYGLGLFTTRVRVAGAASPPPPPRSVRQRSVLDGLSGRAEYS